jgi:NAD-dependent deacetylase
MLDHAIQICRAASKATGRVVVLTGAGISAESGIPTFRGKEGYWTVGAREYHPQELATHEAFEQMPLEVWAWYLYRRGVCRGAAPNPAHLALVRAEQALGDRFALITQNVDGLHRRAGHTEPRLHEIHGDIELARCGDECDPSRWPLGDDVPALGKGERVPDAVAARLVCPRCGAGARPHVLWFDEYYDEERYHLDTVRALAAEAALLVVIGTSAQTNLPWQVVQLAARAGAPIIDVNVEDNPFGEIARRTGGAVLRAAAGAVVPALVDALIAE